MPLLERNHFRYLVALCLAVVMLLAMVPIHDVKADYPWFNSSGVVSNKVTLSQTSNESPGLAYDSSNGKMYLAWQGKDSQYSLNVISSSDLSSWSSPPVTTQNSNIGMIDITYDSSTNKLYMAYVSITPTKTDSNCGGWVTNYDWFVYVTSSPDGSAGSWSQPTQVFKGSAWVGCFANFPQMGASITYDADHNRLVLVTRNTDQTVPQSYHIALFTSTDGGGTWSASSLVYLSGSLAQSGADVEVRYLQVNYYLSYLWSSSIYVLQSSDLGTWTQIPTNGNTAIYTPSLSYNPVEGKYHLNWAGTDSGHSINDAITGSISTGFANPTIFEAALGTRLAYHSVYHVIVLAWTGYGSTTLNVMTQLKPASLSANPQTVAPGSSTTLAVQTSDSMSGIVFSFTTDFGSLSSSTCTTGSTGSCAVTLYSANAGTADIAAYGTAYQTLHNVVTFSNPPPSGGGGGGGGGGWCPGALRCVN